VEDAATADTAAPTMKKIWLSSIVELRQERWIHVYSGGWAKKVER
jgi:hypothetical protein